MEIASIKHKALKRFAETGSTKGLAEPERLRRMLAYLAFAREFEEFSVPPNFGFHQLTGDRKGVYAMTVTKNWRLTFTKVGEQIIANLDLEDYH